MPVGFGQVIEGRLKLLSPRQTAVPGVFNVTDADGDGVAVVAAQPAIILGLGELLRLLLQGTDVILLKKFHHRL